MRYEAAHVLFQYIMVPTLLLTDQSSPVKMYLGVWEDSLVRCFICPQLFFRVIRSVYFGTILKLVAIRNLHTNDERAAHYSSPAKVA